jgi:tetratricopeptide (TPR) repeat protein
MAPDQALKSAPERAVNSRTKGAVTAISEHAACRTRILAILFVGLFAVLLASFPARNLDLWKNLADGRDLLRGMRGPSPTWLYDVTTYLLFSIGGVALAGAKALLCGTVAVLMFRLAGARLGWRIPLAVTGLAVLAMASRMILHPATVSLLFLAVCFWLVHRQEARIPREKSIWPAWQLIVLFVIWANVDARFVLGLAVVALTWLGHELDDRSPDGVGRALGRRAAALAVLVSVSCLSPSHINGLGILPAEIRTAANAFWKGSSTEVPIVNSPFERAYLDLFRDSPAALTIYPLLALGLVSFLLNRREWRWERFLPWLGLAAVCVIQVRLVPFFAVVAGPVTAWNLQEFFARRSDSGRERPLVRYAGLALTSLLAVAFLVSAWPGWLQAPPFEPRRWAVEIPQALPNGAEFLRRAHASKLWPAESRTLHVGPEAAGAIAWFCPEDRGFVDNDLLGQLLTSSDFEPVRERLRALGVSRVVVYAADSSGPALDVLKRLLPFPAEWPVLHLKGGLVVIGWRDPLRPDATDTLKRWEVDFARVAFRPDESEAAPSSRAPDNSNWWDAFWRPAPPSRTAGRDEATVLYHKASALGLSDARRIQVEWEAGQSAALIGAAGAWIAPPGAFKNAPLPAITRLEFGFQQHFEFERSTAPAGVLYAAIRAARRAVAENPKDHGAYLTLGRAYLALLEITSERVWVKRGSQLPSLPTFRQIQACAALNRAVELNPKLAAAHLALGRLYLSLECLDLAVHHLRAYRDCPVHRGGPHRGSLQADAIDAELEHLSQALERETREYVRESQRSSVFDRASIAVRRGLVREAREVLLKSHISAFGAPGMQMLLDLLLRTGRPEDALESMTPEVLGSVGHFWYYTLRTQAFAAIGAYDDIDTELAELVGTDGRMPPATTLAREVGEVVGRSVLVDQPGFHLTPPQAAWLALERSDLRTRFNEIMHRLRVSADAMALRGLMALEAGNIERAREQFRAALTFSPGLSDGGELDFATRSMARDCLRLIDGQFGDRREP